MTRRGYSPQKPELRVSQKRHTIHRDWDTAGEEVPADVTVRAQMLKETYDPTPESPAEIAARRALRGGRPTVRRHWGDAYDPAPDWDTLING